MGLVQLHNTVASVRLEIATPRSRAKHSTTEPLHSLYFDGLHIFKCLDAEYNHIGQDAARSRLVKVKDQGNWHQRSKFKVTFQLV